MPTTLFTSAKEYLTDDVVDSIGGTLDERSENVRAVLDRALAMVLTGLANRVNEPGGASSVMDLTGEVTVPNRVTDELVMPVGGIPAHLADFLSNDSQRAALLTMGADLTQRLFGDQTDAITNRLAIDSNVTSASATTLLNLATPLMLGVLGNDLANTDTGISGLGALLNEQAALSSAPR